MILIMAALSLMAQAPRRTPAPVYTSLEAARPVLQSAPEVPPELRNLGPADLPRAWNEWVRQRDLQIRGRLERGEEDSLANLLIYGTSFTKQPRLTSEFITTAEAQAGAGAGRKVALPVANPNGTAKNWSAP